MSDDESLRPRDHAEAVALFRAQIIGALTRRELDRGDLAAAMRALAAESYRPPGHASTRRFGASTLERWFYAYRADGLAGLRPAPRSDRGRARELRPEQRELLLDIRREHPTASLPLILRTLVADGRLAADVVSATTVTRLYRDAGLERGVRPDGHTRLRWQADHAGALWHGDVCHGPTLRIGTTTRPLRIHAMLDDASRYVVALEAHHTEREVDMLDLLLATLRRHGAPDGLYLDNGSTYCGVALRLCCERLGITLIHARPYDVPARGKMERFWRTLRAGCLDHLGGLTSLHDVQVRLGAFLDEHYHRAPHGGLLGKTPAEAWASASCRAVDEPAIPSRSTTATAIRCVSPIQSLPRAPGVAVAASPQRRPSRSIPPAPCSTRPPAVPLATARRSRDLPRMLRTQGTAVLQGDRRRRPLAAHLQAGRRRRPPRRAHRARLGGARR